MEDKKVRRQLGDSKDSMNELMESIQQANDTAVALQKLQGCQADLLVVKIKPVAKQKGVTVPFSKERIFALDNAKTHGKKFWATGGSHITSNGFFKSLEVPELKRKRKAVEKEKEEKKDKVALEKEASAVLAATGGGPGNLLVP